MKTPEIGLPQGVPAVRHQRYIGLITHSLINYINSSELETINKYIVAPGIEMQLDNSFALPDLVVLDEQSNPILVIEVCKANEYQSDIAKVKMMLLNTDVCNEGFVYCYTSNLVTKLIRTKLDNGNIEVNTIASNSISDILKSCNVLDVVERNM